MADWAIELVEGDYVSKSAGLQAHYLLVVPEAKCQAKEYEVTLG